MSTETRHTRVASSPEVAPVPPPSRSQRAAHRMMAFAMMALAFMLAARPATDPDMWWHLRSGEWMLDHHRILRSDPFSHTSVGYHEPLEWLTQIGMRGIWGAFGIRGLSLSVAVLASLCAYLMYRACEGSSWLRGPIVAVALACAASSGFWTARPQTLTWVFLAATVLAVTAYLRAGADADRHIRRLWLLVPLFALWSNVHLCWFYGLGVLWATVAGEYLERFRRRRVLSARALRSLALVAAACSFAVMVNPVGPRIYDLIASGRNNGKRFHISEFLPPPIVGRFWLFFALLVVTGIVLLLSWRRLSITDLALAVTTGYFAVNTRRMIALFVLVAVPMVSKYLNQFVARGSRWPAKRRRPTKPRSAGPASLGVKALVVAMIVGITMAPLPRRLSSGRIELALKAKYPVNAVEWVKLYKPPGPLFNEYGWGGYLIWNLRSYPVGLDGRAEIHFDDLEEIERGHILEVIRRQGTRLIISPSWQPWIATLPQIDPAWSVAYRDPVATVLTRPSPP